MTYSDKALQVGASIAHIRIHHTRFKEALDGVGRIVQLGDRLRQPVGASIVAPAGAGKTLLIESIQKNVCGWPFLRQNSVLVASLKESPTVAQIQADLLANFNYAIPLSARKQTNAVLFNVLADAIAQHDIRLIALDEYQHVFLAHKTEVHASINDWIKRLMSRTARPVLLSGTDTLRAIEKADPQLSTRISSIFNLPDFKNDQEWKGILSAFAGVVNDVDLSSLAANYSTAVFRAANGKMRTLKLLIIEASMVAIDSNEHKIEKPHLRLAFQRMFGTGSSRDNPFY